MKKIFGLLLASVAMIMGFVSCSADTDTGSSKITLDVYFTDAKGNTDYTDEVYVVTEDVDGMRQMMRHSTERRTLFDKK